MNFKKLGFGAVLLVSMVNLSGCLAVNVKDSTTRGPEITVESMDMFVKGETRYDAVVAKMGVPSSEEVDGDKKVLTYRWSKTKTRNTAVLFLFVSSDTDTHKRSVTFTFEKDVLKEFSVVH